MKIFKMNDFDWVAANSAEEAKNWYLEEYGLTIEEEPDEPIEVSENDELWSDYEGEDYEEIKKKLEQYLDGKQMIINRKEFMLYDGVKQKMTFKEVLEQDNMNTPYLVSSIEF